MIPVNYSMFAYLFEDPEKLYTIDNPILICKMIGSLYADDLQRIILNSPPTQGEIYLYKASNPYHELRVGNNVLQKSFNSSSYSPFIDFSAFLPNNPLCCMHKITVPEGSHVLFIPDSISAYPDEDEVIIPRESTVSVRESILTSNFVTKNPDKDIQIQKYPFVLGPIMVYNKFSVFTGEYKDLTTYLSVLEQ